MTMPRRSLVVIGFLLSAALLGGADLTSGQQAAEKKPAKLKVLVPDDTNHHKTIEVTLDGQPTKETGTERVLTTKALEAGKKHTLEVKVVIRPNNYTTITRTRKVDVEADKTVAVDLRKEDKNNPDDILVRFVPTPSEVVQAMIKLAGVTKDDVVYDLGCGDGRIVIAAVKSGAKKGVGVDIDPKLVEQCKNAAKKEKLEEKLEFREGDVLKIKDLSDASVVMLYMGHDLNKKLQPILQKTLQPGARVVSHRFLMDDDWPPDVTQKIRAKDNYGEDDDFEIHLWKIKEKK
jgi:uncharacterized protein (TIGR03000 family)